MGSSAVGTDPVDLMLVVANLKAKPFSDGLLKRLEFFVVELSDGAA